MPADGHVFFRFFEGEESLNRLHPFKHEVGQHIHPFQ
jgi:hypothetical protein